MLTSQRASPNTKSVQLEHELVDPARVSRVANLRGAPLRLGQRWQLYA